MHCLRNWQMRALYRKHVSCTRNTITQIVRQPSLDSHIITMGSLKANWSLGKCRQFKDKKYINSGRSHARLTQWKIDCFDRWVKPLPKTQSCKYWRNYFYWMEGFLQVNFHFASVTFPLIADSSRVQISYRKKNAHELYSQRNAQMGQRKTGISPSSIQKINAVVMGKDGVGKSGKGNAIRLLSFDALNFDWNINLRNFEIT